MGYVPGDVFHVHPSRSCALDYSSCRPTLLFPRIGTWALVRCFSRPPRLRLRDERVTGPGEELRYLFTRWRVCVRLRDGGGGGGGSGRRFVIGGCGGGGDVVLQEDGGIRTGIRMTQNVGGAKGLWASKSLLRRMLGREMRRVWRTRPYEERF